MAEAEIQQPPRKKTRAEYQRDYRRRIKESKEIYDVFREHEKIRSRLWRLNRNSEVKAKEREQARIRAQRYRQKYKGERSSQSAKMSKKVTRAEKQALQEKWRKAKRKYPSNMSSQKRRRVNELRRQKHAESKHVSTIHNQSPDPSSEGLFTSDSARRKAVSRSLRVLPKDPQRFAEVITSMVKTATPKKKNALKRRMILSPSQKKRQDFLNKNSVKAIIQQIKHSRSRKDLELRQLLHIATTIKKKKKQFAEEDVTQGVRSELELLKKACAAPPDFKQEKEE
ncbi:hypothetical protein HOLleu_44021 [Holothuria leucospilota]|uniref:Uncharacterized protein n=1 Tax=Holothuria leucospilota TaxID=206669 RepID=A0A9Q0YDR9_HOLLE|nr:hypothetical protein HOLleu_44021 [Holothuria leucospilota]